MVVRAAPVWHELAMPGHVPHPASVESARAFRRADLALGACVLLARVPFLAAGYGSDPDAWRVAWTGRVIAATGRYQASRAPGNPIPELAAAVFAHAPPAALNAVSALASAAAAVLFGVALRRLGCRAWLAGAAALAFTPVVAIHGADAMDYDWALALMLAAFVAVLDRRAALAGLCIGVATGCRITSLAMLVPMSVLLGWPRGGSERPGAGARSVATLWLVGLSSAAAAFAPVIATYGRSFLHDYAGGYPPPLYVLKNLTVDVWGLVGCIALAIGAAAALVHRMHHAGNAALRGPMRALDVAAWAMIAIVTLVFLRLPHEAGYLIPAVPFVLLLFARALPPRGFAGLCIAIVVSSLVVKVSEPGKPDSPPPGPFGRVMTVGDHDFQIDVLRGPILHDLARRNEMVRYAGRVRDRVRTMPSHATLIAYEWLPPLRVLAHGNQLGTTRLVYLLSPAELDSARRIGPVVHLPSAEPETMRRYGYDLDAHGSPKLDVP